jgi:UDP-N-acetylmuramoyl-tripeptide--D-alanyl-D-alanine ligase
MEEVSMVLEQAAMNSSMNLDEFCAIVGGEFLGATDEGQLARIARIVVSGAALRIEEAAAGRVFFVFCQLDYSNNCFNGSFPDATDRGVVDLLLARGTELCVLRRENYERHRDWLAPYRGHLIVVDDAIVALQRFARAVLERHPLPIIGITGSAGKTTTKELTAHILSGLGARVLYSAGNQNNGIGLPFTVQKLLSSTAAAPYNAAVLEMGMSTRDDEIARLCRIAPPDVALVLNVLPVHMEHMLTLDGVEQGKAQIVENMNHDGVAVLNSDDARVSGMRAKAGRSMTFGLGPEADVRAGDIRFERDHTAFTLHYRGESAAVRSMLRGEHNVMNLLAASAACLAYDGRIELAAIAAQLATFAAPVQRGREILLSNGVTLIDDTYNSNPQSLLMAVKAARVLAGSAGRLVVAAGGMHELGPASRQLHVDTGSAIAGLGADILFSAGLHADDLIEGFRQACTRCGEARRDVPGLLAVLVAALSPGDILLIKGSRAERLETLVQALCKKQEHEWT